jgi:D-alanine-D-alanine ligase
MSGEGMSGSRTRVVVLFGGRSAEHEVSCMSAVSVLRSLDPARYDVVPIGVTQDGTWVRSDSAMQLLAGVRGSGNLPKHLVAAGPMVDASVVLSGGTAPDDDAGGDLVVFPILHGPLGEDGTVQGMLELAGVPYVGSGVLGSSVSMDKAMTKTVFDALGIPQAKWVARRSWDLAFDTQVATFTTEVADSLGWPVFVKPANMGSSVGVTKANDADEFVRALTLAMQFDDTVIVEENVVGREIEFGVLGNEFPEVSVAGEIKPAKAFYDFEDKYVDGAADLMIPAPLAPEVAAAGQALALDVYRAVRAEGLSRVDFFYEESGRGWLVNEINTIPGFTPISMYPKLWEASGVSYSELVDRLIALALARHKRRAAYVGRVRTAIS